MLEHLFRSVSAFAGALDEITTARLATRSDTVFMAISFQILGTENAIPICTVAHIRLLEIQIRPLRFALQHAERGQPMIEKGPLPDPLMADFATDPIPPKKSAERVIQKSVFDSDLLEAAEKLAWNDDGDKAAGNRGGNERGRQ